MLILGIVLDQEHMSTLPRGKDGEFVIKIFKCGQLILMKRKVCLEISLESFFLLLIWQAVGGKVVEK